MNDITRSDLPIILAELQKNYDSCKEDGWDGLDAYSISEKTFKCATDLVINLPLGIKAPDIIPETDGDITFEWSTDNKNFISVSVGDDNVIFYNALIKSIAFNGTLKFTGLWPVSVIDIIKSLLDIV
jgi:hypothetical protein